MNPAGTPMMLCIVMEIQLSPNQPLGEALAKVLGSHSAAKTSRVRWIAFVRLAERERPTMAFFYFLQSIRIEARSVVCLP